MSRMTFPLALILIFGAGCAEAEPSRPLPPAAKVSLVDAITTAQQYSPGQPIRAEYEQQRDGKWVYDIKVASGDALTEVKIDANDGTFLGIRNTKQQADEGDDERDDDKD